MRTNLSCNIYARKPQKYYIAHKSEQDRVNKSRTVYIKFHVFPKFK